MVWLMGILSCTERCGGFRTPDAGGIQHVSSRSQGVSGLVASLERQAPGASGLNHGAYAQQCGRRFLLKRARG